METNERDTRYVTAEKGEYLLIRVECLLLYNLVLIVKGNEKLFWPFLFDFLAKECIIICLFMN